MVDRIHMAQKKTIYSFIGLPASGKGTQAAILAKKLGLKIVGMGDLIRETMAGDLSDPFVAEIKKRYDAGTPQPDSVAIDLVKNYLAALETGVILDNFPLTAGQSEFLDKFLNIHSDWDFVLLYIKVDPETAIKRVTTRKVCSECGSVYGATDEMICEKCGGALIVRTDDNEDIMRTRIEHYLPKIRETLAYFADKDFKVFDIGGEGTVEEVAEELQSKL